MSETGLDFLVVGGTPLALLLAGLLQAEHGRRVGVLDTSFSRHRLPHGHDLSAALITRPETAALVSDGTNAVLKLLGRMGGRNTWRRLHPILFADDAASREALSHMRHVAIGHGQSVEPIALGQDRLAFRVRDAVYLERAALLPALQAWLARQAVLRLAPDIVEITETGGARLQVGSTEISATQTILVGSEAVLAHIAPGRMPGLLRRAEMASIMTRTLGPLAAPAMIDAGSGLCLLQRPDGATLGIGPDGDHRLSERMQRLLGESQVVEYAGHTRFMELTPMDNAPAFGRLDGTGPDIIVGMGTFGAFLAPALARWIAGVSATHEAAWFGARLVDRSSEDSTIAEFAAARPEDGP